MAGKTSEDIAQEFWARDDKARALAQKYEIDSWVAINQVVTISWETWLNLDNLLKRAIALEVENVVRERQSAQSDQQRKIDRVMAEQSAGLRFPNPIKSSIQDILNK